MWMQLNTYVQLKNRPLLLQTYAKIQNKKNNCFYCWATNPIEPFSDQIGQLNTENHISSAKGDGLFLMMPEVQETQIQTLHSFRGKFSVIRWSSWSTMTMLTSNSESNKYKRNHDSGKHWRNGKSCRLINKIQSHASGSCYTSCAGAEPNSLTDFEVGGL